MSNDTEKAFDAAMDALIAQACAETEDKIFDSYEEKLKDQKIVFSKEHNAFMETLLDAERSKIKKTKHKRIRKRILIAAIIVLTILLALALTVSAFREKIIDFTLDIANKNSEIQFEKEEEIFFEKTNMNISYIPQNFEEEKRYTADGYVYAKYSYGDLWFTVEKEIVPDNMTIDTENAEIEETEINGCKAVISIKDNLVIIVWTKGDHAYITTGNITKDELIEISKNIS